VRTEAGALEQRRQPGGGQAASAQLTEHPAEILVRRLEPASRDAVGGERALHARIGGDHRTPRIALRAQIVQRLLENVGQHFCDLPVPRKAPPAPALGDQEGGQGDPACPEDRKQRRETELGLMGGVLRGRLLVSAALTAREGLVLLLR
jgi:hypothetical protein